MLLDGIARHIFPRTPPILIDGPSGSSAIHHLDTSNIFHVHRVSSCDSDKRMSSCAVSARLQPLLTTELTGRVVTINILPDNVLLHIFHSYRSTYLDGPDQFDLLWSWRWRRLAHVCQRWRAVVFASPNFLDLRLLFDPWTRVELTDIWPPLPTIIRNMADCPMPEDYDFDAATVHHNHVYEIDLFYLTNSQLQRLASAMQKQFPALTHLLLESAYDCRPATALPDGFLGGFAPRLQSLELYSIPFPTLPKLLLSATDLVYLTLSNIPHSGYISPEVIVTGLAVLVNLRTLTLDFESPRSRPDRKNRRPPPPIRTVLPSLTRFGFHGVSEYLEDLVARIDAPLLDSIRIDFFHQLIFDIPQLAQFMRRMTGFMAIDEIHVVFDDYGVRVECIPPTMTFDKTSRLRISCRWLDWQLSSLEQVFTSFFPSIHMVEYLYIYTCQYSSSRQQDDIENTHWLESLHPFTAVTNLYICEETAQSIAPALQDLVGERAIDVLPALENFYWEELQPRRPVREAFGQFIAARELLGRPVAISNWNRR